MRPYWRMAIGLAVIIFIIEVTKIVDKLLFKVLVDRGTEFADGMYSQSAFWHMLILLGLSFAGVIILRSVMVWFRAHFLQLMEVSAIRDLKRLFFDHLLRLSHRFHTSHKTGSLISRLIRGGGAFERMTDAIFFDAFPLVFQIVLLGFSLAFLDVATLLPLILVVVLFVVTSLYILRLQQTSNLRANETEDAEKANISDFFTNVDSIKYFGKEDLVSARFSVLTQKTKNAFRSTWGYFRWIGSLQTFIVGMGTLAVLAPTLIKFLHHEIRLGTVVFIFSAYGNLLEPMYRFVGAIRNFYRSMADFEALFGYYRLHNDIHNVPHAQRLTVRHGEIEFRDVTFGYQDKPLFKNFNLHIKKHQKIALVGHSGCGKTTLIKLLYRLYDPERGSIMIDGHDIRKFTQESLRSELSIVPQDCVLFDDTIYNNIAFSNPYASRRDVLRALRFAQLDTFVDSLPQKERTVVGERGVKLSGGEKQRVSIARALLADKKILVLDEATSSLDSKTEHEIQRDLQRLMKGRTTIIIAHRLSTVMKADVIVVLDKGAITQLGTHRELLKKGGLYKTLWSLQRGGYLSLE